MKEIKTRNNIVIIGGGFAGISCARALLGKKNILNRKYNLILIDEKDYSEFLPMLPDMLSSRVDEKYLKMDLLSFCKKNGITFVKARVNKIDLIQRKISAGLNEIYYEYCVISSGARTNFFGDFSAENKCLKLDSVEDVNKIHLRIEYLRKKFSLIHAVIIGGGYTGIETATSLHHLFNKRGLKSRITIIEKSQDILITLPEWVRKKVRAELDKLNIKIMCNESAGKFLDESIILSSGTEIKNVMSIWTAGVKTPEYINSLNLFKEKTRLRVSDNLSLENSGYPDVFVVGDSAAFVYGDKDKINILRMAAMFAIGEGRTAGKNIINRFLGKPMVRFEVKDLGYIIPLTYNKGVGLVLGKKVGDRIAFFLHYIMCIYRSEWPNKFGILKNLILKKH